STLHIDPVGVVTVNSFLEASGSTIKSVVSGSPATISMPSGIDNCFENLTIKDINAIGGASFTAAQGYDNQGGNSGWTFSNDPCAGSSSMARMTEATALDTSSSTLIPSVIYPNPFESNFTVINPYQGKGEVEVRIIDQAGKIVFLEKRDAGAEQFDIQVKTIKRGMYMLMLTQGDKMISHKIVKE
ncbi:MAG: T9SS type A sorting domain-containing protein, partial [Imperialibacter sp.]|uniref:T9SS type A sorting domain-containing protein n=1 Tax=Imperialibacter sp. TaxID=2038411 RepID=UPI0032F08E64